MDNFPVEILYVPGQVVSSCRYGEWAERKKCVAAKAPLRNSSQGKVELNKSFTQFWFCLL